MLKDDILLDKEKKYCYDKKTERTLFFGCYHFQVYS